MEQTEDKATGCLDSRDVEALLAGQMLPQDISRVMAHLADCPTCRDRVRCAGYQGLAAASAHDRPLDKGIGDAASSKQFDRPTTAETLGDPAADAPKPVSLRFEFLAPAEASGELGRLGGYRILRVIGEGGMGVVFEADDPQLQRHVAIKVFKPQGLEETNRERFLQEARVSASLASPRIVTIHQIGEDRGCPFLVMELLHGESLDGLLKRRRTLPVSEALPITREVAEGLELAHEKGLIHRDIKPANIWLEEARSGDVAPQVKLLDFGIACLIESQSRLTDEGRIVGTPSYLCPELASRQPVDGRADLFSLGCVLYAMLAGKSPFERAGASPSIRAVVEEDPEPLGVEVPPAIADLIGRLLNKDPQDRPATARQVVEEVRAIESTLSA